jgi:hypothetical protein
MADLHEELSISRLDKDTENSTSVYGWLYNDVFSIPQTIQRRKVECTTNDEFEKRIVEAYFKALTQH